jgi:hypothetical protein
MLPTDVQSRELNHDQEDNVQKDERAGNSVQGLDYFVYDKGRKRRRMKRLKKLASTGMSHELDGVQQDYKHADNLEQRLEQLWTTKGGRGGDQGGQKG